MQCWAGPQDFSKSQPVNRTAQIYRIGTENRKKMKEIWLLARQGEGFGSGRVLHSPSNSCY
jgi:hypothetical protein